MSDPNAMFGRAGALVVFVATAACSGTSVGTAADGGSSDAGGNACSALASSASQEVSAVLEAHRACTQASDCMIVSLSASCFDACTRAARVDATEALNAVGAKVNAAQCMDFTKASCRVTIPPCEPPRLPTCVAGSCTE
jgi:hypothetical protein